MSLLSRIFSLSSFMVEYSNGNTIRSRCRDLHLGSPDGSEELGCQRLLHGDAFAWIYSSPSPTPPLKTSIRAAGRWHSPTRSRTVSGSQSGQSGLGPTKTVHKHVTTNTTSFIGPSSSPSKSSLFLIPPNETHFGGVPITSKILINWCVSARISSPKRSCCCFSLRFALSGKHDFPGNSGCGRRFGSSVCSSSA